MWTVSWLVIWATGRVEGVTFGKKTWNEVILIGSTIRSIYVCANETLCGWSNVNWQLSHTSHTRIHRVCGYTRVRLSTLYVIFHTLTESGHMKLNVKYAQLISSTKLDQLFNVNPVQSSQLMWKSHNICKFIYDLSEKSKETGPKTSGSSHVRAGQCPVCPPCMSWLPCRCPSDSIFRKGCSRSLRNLLLTYLKGVWVRYTYIWWLLAECICESL